MVSSARDTAVLLAQHSNAPIAARVSRRDVKGRIGRPVVDDDQFEIVKRLTEHRLDRIGKIGFDLVRRRDYADGWHCISRAVAGTVTGSSSRSSHNASTDRRVAPPGR